MELKTIVATGLVVYFVGSLIFIKINGNKKSRPWAAEKAALLHTRKIKGGFYLWFISLIQT